MSSSHRYEVQSGVMNTQNGGDNNEFEAGVRLIREAYSKRLAQKETEVVSLRGENARHRALIEDLQRQNKQLVDENLELNQKLTDLNKNLNKLNQFRSTVLQSFSESGLEVPPEFSLPHSSHHLHTVQGGRSVSYQPFIKSQAGHELAGNATSILRDQSNTFRFSTALNNRTLNLNNNNNNIDNNNNNSNFPADFGQDVNINDVRSPTSASRRTVFDRDQQQQQQYSQQQKQVSSVDAREFFKHLKKILSYQEYTDLYNNVKKYNQRQQSSSITLQNVYEIIGLKYPLLYSEFEKIMGSN
ncbi:hypothetical protein MIR68_008235 [Amoeboaphelidium protococcarum]|nr:hypothetical protein MIR68_008235 [Amoeboaphelidium protococcarum]